jgi:hypothetical protein
MQRLCKLIVLLFLLAVTTGAWATTFGPLPHNKHIFVYMANTPKFAGEDDAVYNTTEDPHTYDNYYYIRADGGGLNQLHTTYSLDSINGQDYSTSSQSGSFWITTTGGRGYNDTIILMISVKGTIPENFSVHIKSSGYTWSTPGDYTNGEHQTDVIDQTFTKSDFDSYGYASNVYKPGPGNYDSWTLPLFTGQTDFSTNETLLFIDLKVGNIYNSSLIEKGAAKVEYTFSNMNTSASFNAYAWCKYANQPQGINWTQATTGSGTSSYTVNY